MRSMETGKSADTRIMEDAVKTTLFRRVLPLLFLSTVSAGCGTTPPAALPAAEPTFTEEAVPLTEEVQPVPASSPADDSGLPAVYASVTLEGALTVTSQRYAEVLDMCNPFPPGASGCGTETADGVAALVASCSNADSSLPA